MFWIEGQVYKCETLYYSTPNEYSPSNDYCIYPHQKLGFHAIADHIVIVGILDTIEGTDSLLFTPSATIRRGIFTFGKDSLSEDSVIYVELVQNQKRRLELLPRAMRATETSLNVKTQEDLSPYPDYNIVFRVRMTKEEKSRELLSRESQINYFIRVNGKDSSVLVSPMDTVLGPEPSRLALYRKRKIGVYMPHERGAVVGTLHFREEGDTITFVPRVYVDTLLRTHLCDSLAPTADIARRRIILTADSMEVIPDIGRRRVYRR